MYSWTDATVLSVVKAHLADGALKWLLSKIDTIHTFNDFKERFAATFTYAHSRSEQLRSMSARIQKSGETIQEYVLDKVWLCKNLDLTVADVRDEVAAGLWSKDLAQYLLVREYTSTDATLQDLVRVDRIQQNRREMAADRRSPRGAVRATRVFTATGTRRADIGKASHPEQRDEKSDKVSEKTVVRGNNAIKCFNCGGLGHLSRDCKSEKRVVTCYLCKRPGHVASRCANNKQTNNVNSSKPSGNEVNMVRSNEMGDVDGKFVREIGIGSTKVVAWELRTVLEGFGRGVVESPGVIEEDAVFDQLKPRTTTFRVVPDESQRHDVILGRTFTEALDLVYTRIGDDLKFMEIDPAIFHTYRKTRAPAIGRIELEPGVVNFVDLKLESHTVNIPVVNQGDRVEIITAGDRVGEPILSVERVSRRNPRVEEIVEEEVIVDKSVTEKQRKELVDLLNRYRICVAKNLSELGVTNQIEMTIATEKDAVVQAKPYRLNASDRDDLDKIIQEYKQAGIVTETDSPFASPVFVVRKKDGTARMVLQNARLTLNLDKCKFGMRRVEYLGYVLGEGGVQPGERKIAAIEQFPQPQSKGDIRRFIGLASFFRRFVVGFASLARPLTYLLKEDNIFRWEEDQEQAFQIIKQKLATKPVLKLYNPKAHCTELHTDASSMGIGAMLLQADFENDPLKLVYAVSRSTTECEANYHSSRLELMAVAWALRRLRPFLIGLAFTVVTDCQSLIHISAWKTKNPQIARWMSELSEFDFQLKHRPGKCMQHVDALSRAPVNVVQDQTATIFQIVTNEDEVLVFQRSDSDILRLVKILQKQETDRNNHERQLVKTFVLRDGLLYKKIVVDNVERELFVVPKTMRKSIVIRYHDLTSHFGVDKTIKRITE
ncbi:uncharacterized protein LOC123987989 [Osmia bicornis bicornis]|uniref:uncharacterized protein LOC123987989 n=1 Tax=Osmia bicornis bicornis TaxID=1437191 RepID=UPI001EAF3E1A|nr:uncharacterized protein LOC123987989 [Osmia bicornis bicornis]